MARTRKSHATGEEETKTSSGKPLAAYSPKVDGHKYVIYCSYNREGDEIGRILVLKFLGTFAAKHFVLKLIGTDEFEWDKWNDCDEMIVTSRGIKIRASGDQMREINDYVMTPAEEAWTDEGLNRSIGQFKFGRDEFTVTHRSADDELPDDAEHTAEAKPGRRAHAERAPREPKEVKVKPDLTGYVSANDIAEQLGVLGREVRGVLRSLALTKPEHGWSWPAKEAKEMKKTIEKGLKDAKKGKKK